MTAQPTRGPSGQLASHPSPGEITLGTQSRDDGGGEVHRGGLGPERRSQQRRGQEADEPGQRLGQIEARLPGQRLQHLAGDGHTLRRGSFGASGTTTRAGAKWFPPRGPVPPGPHAEGDGHTQGVAWRSQTLVVGPQRPGHPGHEQRVSGAFQGPSGGPHGGQVEGPVS